jgi:tetratricopeptide (TPR) repeat protein
MHPSDFHYDGPAEGYDRVMEDPQPGAALTDHADVDSLRLRRIQIVVAVVIVGLIGCASWMKAQPGASTESHAQELIEHGMSLLARNEPDQAANYFRAALALSPQRSRAAYQLATALDRSGRAEEARPYWENVLQMAEASKDTPTAATARARLAQQP